MYAEGYKNISYLDTCNRRDFLHRYLSTLNVSQHRGAFILGLSLEDHEFRQIASYASEGAPVIFIQNGPSELPPNCGFVGLNNYKSAQIATEQLWNNGYRKIAAVCTVSGMEDPVHAVGIDRIEGYCDSISELGGEPYVVRASTAGSNSIVSADMPELPEAVQIVLSDHKVDALLTLNSDVATEAVRAMRNKSLTPGVDLALFSLGCRQWMHDVCFPPLSHIALPHYGTGRRAARMFLELSGHNHEQSSPEQIVRMLPATVAEMLHVFEEGSVRKAS
jgi:DNA-binding LacI/PurR family transcriptional regulator